MNCIRLLAAPLLALLLCMTGLPVQADETSEVMKLVQAGQATEAMVKLDQFLALKPKDPQLRFLKGVMLSDAKRSSEAIAVFTLLNEDYPELPEPYNNLAVLLAAEGHLNEALAALQAALRNDPTHRAARENLGDVHLALAIQAWNAAQSGDAKTDAHLRRKLQLARQIQAQAG